MMYYIVFGSLLLASPIAKKADAKIVTNFFFLVLILFAGCRFAMGRDYISYYSLFLSAADNFDDYFSALFEDGKFNFFVSKYANSQEFGYVFTETLVKSFGKSANLSQNSSFLLFVAFIAFLNISFVFYTIQKYSVCKPLSIFIFLCNYYVWYLEGTFRSSMAMAVFIYAFYDYISGKRGFAQTLKYFLFLFLAMSFHVSAFIGVVIPLIIKIPLKTILNPYFLIIASSIAIALSFLMPIVLGALLSGALEGKGTGYIQGEGAWSTYALGLRAFYLVFIYVMVRKKTNELSFMETSAIKVLFTGIALYFMFSRHAFMSRLSDMFIVIEIILLPNLLLKLFPKQKRSLYQFIVTVLFTVLYVKDLKNNIERSTDGTLLGYKYVSIFDKQNFLELPPSEDKRYQNLIFDE